MIKMIANVSSNGVIGKDGNLAVKYKEDLKLFKQKTLNSTVIMGRKTFESMGSKPLSNRKNIVVSSTLQSDNVIVVKTLKLAIQHSSDDNIWIIGGHQMYLEGMKYADSIHLTLSPDIIVGDNLVTFPWINPNKFYIYTLQTFQNDKRLKECIYLKKK